MHQTAGIDPAINLPTPKKHIAQTTRPRQRGAGGANRTAYKWGQFAVRCFDNTLLLLLFPGFITVVSPGGESRARSVHLVVTVANAVKTPSVFLICSNGSESN